MGKTMLQRVVIVANTHCYGTSVVTETGCNHLDRQYQEGFAKQEANISECVEQEMLLNSLQFKTKKTKATAAQLMALLKRQNFRCALSGLQLTPDVAVIDHIVPVSSGGSNAIENLQWLHANVNRAKGVLTQEEFIRVCSLVTTYQR